MVFTRRCRAPNNTGYAGYFNNTATQGFSVYPPGAAPNYFAGNVGIGPTSPGAPLDVAVPSATTNPFQGTIYSNTAAWGAGIILRRADGTSGSPTAVNTGDVLGGMYGQGYGATGFSSNKAAVYFSATQT